MILPFLCVPVTKFYARRYLPMSRKELILTIEEPCSQNWDTMKETGSRRFCDTCQKNVVDFSTFSDTQLLKWFELNRNGVCGRLSNLQIDRMITAEKPARSLFLKPYRIALTAMMWLGIWNRDTLDSEAGNPARIEACQKNDKTRSATGTTKHRQDYQGETHGFKQWPARRQCDFKGIYKRKRYYFCCN
jgi:hypothetical protein